MVVRVIFFIILSLICLWRALDLVDEFAKLVRDLHDFVIFSIVGLFSKIGEGFELDVGDFAGMGLGLLLLGLNLFLEFLNPLIEAFHLVLILLVLGVPSAQLCLQLLDAVVLLFD